MNIYFAPMEGITGHVYRKVVWDHFPYVDKFYAPFIQPNAKRVFVPKEERDILPEHNEGLPVVPQILTNHADGFIRAGKALEAYGYSEINLNLGCPSGTVVAKGKGAGMLVDKERLRVFLEDVFSVDWKADITIKTRLGMTDTDDFMELFQLLCQFPIRELIVHPRFRTDFYRGIPRTQLLQQAMQNGRQTEKGAVPICYNGNIFTRQDWETIQIQYVDTPFHAVMLGRGLLANPALARELRGGSPLQPEELRRFHDDIFEAYRRLDFGEKNILFKMKELWNYWGWLFGKNERELKKVRKANRFTEYLDAINILFANAEFIKIPCGLWNENDRNHS